MIGRPWTLAGPADDRRADRDRRGAGPPRPVQEPPELVRMTLAPARGSHRGQRPRGRTQRPDGWQQPRTKTCPSRPQNPCGPGGVHGWTGQHNDGSRLTIREPGWRRGPRRVLLASPAAPCRHWPVVTRVTGARQRVTVLICGARKAGATQPERWPVRRRRRSEQLRHDKGARSSKRRAVAGGARRQAFIDPT